MEGSFRGNGLGAVVNPRAGGVPALLPPGYQATALRRGHQRVVRRSGDEERVLPLRSDQLSRSASLLRSSAISEFVWTQCVGDAFACRAVEHRLCVACVEVRAIRRKKREPNRCAGHGDIARVRFLRALRHSRSVAAILLDDIHFGAARFVEARHADLLAVRRRGVNRHDPHEGNLRHSCRVRPACDSNSGSFVHAKPRSGRQACKANLELDRSRHDRDRRRICYRLFLFGNIL